MGFFQERNRQEIRHSVGRNVGDVVIGEAESTVDTTSLIDTLHLRGGDDEYNGRQVMIYSSAGSIAAGEKAWVIDFDGDPTNDATTTAFSASITDGDKYEMWHVLTVEEVNDVINQAILDVTRKALINRQTTGNFTQENVYEYDWVIPYAFGLDFRGIHTVEYAFEAAVYADIDLCDSAWTAGSNTTVTADTSHKMEGDASCKIVIAAGAGTSEILAYNEFTSVDISECDKAEISVYSTIALSAGELQLRLDDTSGGGSVLESLDIPATSANTWTRHSISLSNPLSDTAILRAEIYQVTDVGACTVYVDYISAVKENSKIFRELNPDFWSITKASTPLLKLTPHALSLIGNYHEVRISGYAAPDIFSDDTTDSEVDPSYIINYATAFLLYYHYKSNRLEIEGRKEKAEGLMKRVDKQKIRITTPVQADTRWL